MSPADIRAAMALPGWRWMPGMLAVMDWTPTDGGGPLCARLSTGREQAIGWTPEELPRPSKGHAYFPDLSDPATGGALLSMLGGSVAVHVRADPLAWKAVFWGNDDRQHATGWRDTLAEACIRVALARGRWG